MAFLKAFIDTFVYLLIVQNFYKKLLAYGYVISCMKYDHEDQNFLSNDLKRNDVWNDELPSIYNLDEITNEMNSQRDKLNKTFKFNVVKWNRNDVRNLMQAFKQMHNDFSKLKNKNFTLIESYSTLKTYIEISFWRRFKINYKLNCLKT